jgi:hypothetical protein
MSSPRCEYAQERDRRPVAEVCSHRMPAQGSRSKRGRKMARSLTVHQGGRRVSAPMCSGCRSHRAGRHHLAALPNRPGTDRARATNLERTDPAHQESCPGPPKRPEARVPNPDRTAFPGTYRIIHQARDNTRVSDNHSVTSNLSAMSVSLASQITLFSCKIMLSKARQTFYYPSGLRLRSEAIVTRTGT